MKVCTGCQKTYADDDLNFCLSCGGFLQNQPSPFEDAPPPTVMMNQARNTDQTNQSTWDNPQSPPSNSPAMWENQGFQSNLPPFMAAQQHSYNAIGQDQTLPTISLVLGILGLALFCCYGGVPFGLAAAITGYIGMNNANNNPDKYGGRGLAIAGLVLGAVSLLGGALMIILVILGRH